jgi:hypothetical protein
MADRSSNEADFLFSFLYLAWRLRKSVVTLVFTVITISGRIFQHLRLPVFQWHRPPLTASRWDIRWLIGRRTKPTSCVFSVLNAAVMERCCDACREEEYYLRLSFSVSGGPGLSEASNTVDRKSMGHKMADRSSNEADFLCFSCTERGGCVKVL